MYNNKNPLNVQPGNQGRQSQNSNWQPSQQQIPQTSLGSSGNQGRSYNTNQQPNFQQNPNSYQQNTNVQNSSQNQYQEKNKNYSEEDEWSKKKKQIMEDKKKIQQKDGQHYDDFSVYEGQIERNQRHGKGLFYIPSGDIYYGLWSNDQFTKGVILFNTQEIYEGDIQDGKKNGKGKFTYNDGSYYDGQWKDDQQDGYGIFSLKNGLKYEGNWKQGKKNGKGKLSFSNSKDYYDGDWQDDKRHGVGVQQQDTTNYNCKWENDLPHGQGVVNFANVGMFDGILFQGQLVQGKFEFNDRSIYQGSFKDGKRHGDQCKYTNQQGDQYEGQFRDDQFNGKGKIKFQNGDHYEGDFKDGKFHGTGTYNSIVQNKKDSQDKGFVYQGHFFNGLRHGKGKQTFLDGSSFEGEWFQDKKNGIFTMYSGQHNKYTKSRFDNDNFKEIDLD